MWIILPYDNNRRFHISALIRYFIEQGRAYIVQAQQQVSLTDHTKPNSLDYWIRSSIAVNSDTKQATNEVLEQICSTGLFEENENLICPDTGNECKGIRLVQL